MACSTDSLLLAAVANNVRWCRDVCADEPDGEPAAARIDSGVWVATAPPPPLFPDLVTTRPGVAAAEVAGLLAARATCSVKDSFAELDLTPHGFEKLIEARWIGRPRSTTPGRDAPWARLTEPGDLERWGSAADLPALTPHRLLNARHSIVVAREQRGQIVAGAIMTDSDDVVGVSNVFATPPAADTVWADLLATTDALSPSRQVVGYEHGADLERALAAGFTDLGPLVVWLRIDGQT